MVKKAMNDRELNTKERLFEKAIDLLSQHGYHGVSIRDITRGVGIKESSFYNHFRGKDDLIETIYTFFKNELIKIKPPEQLNDDAYLETVDPLEYLGKRLTIFRQYADTPLMAKIYRIVVMEQFADSRARDILIGLYENPLPVLEQYFTVILRQKPYGAPYSPKILANNYQFALHALIAEFTLLKQYQYDITDVEKRMADLNRFYGSLLKTF